MSRKDSEIFATRLREARESAELSQSELAEKAKLQPSAISHFETGKRKPSFDNLRSLADALNVTTDYLLGRADSSEQGKSRVESVFRHMENMTDSNRAFLEEIAQLMVNKAEDKKKK